MALTGDHVPQFSILFAPDLQANPAEDGTSPETCIVINFKKRVVLICGTSYAGEMKKSAFTILNCLSRPAATYASLLGEKLRRWIWPRDSTRTSRSFPG